MQAFEHVVIIGTGNVAYHLCSAFSKVDITTLIWGRQKKKANEIATQFHIQQLTNLSSIPTDSLVLICVSDDAISSVLEKLPHQLKIAYTSGSVEISSLPQRLNLGVFYPLQTFSIDRELDISTVPFLIEANNKEFADELIQFAKKISNTVHYATSEERFQTHIAAVIVNNFSNYLFYAAEQHLEEHQLSFDLLKPLIHETVKKLDGLSPLEAQTGPASRGDLQVIEKHIHSLSSETLKMIYENISEAISKEMKKS